MLHFEKAKTKDAQTLALVSRRAFDNDVHYGAAGPGGPPGYKSDQWQSKMMRIGDYYKILADEQITGGFIIFRKKPREYELGRIFIDPDFQNQGIGTQAFEFIWETYPLAMSSVGPWARLPGTSARATSIKRLGLWKLAPTGAMAFFLRSYQRKFNAKIQRGRSIKKKSKELCAFASWC